MTITKRPVGGQLNFRRNRQIKIRQNLYRVYVYIMAILFHTAKFKSANTQFGGKPPNLMTANISGYRPFAKLWPLINACCYGNELENGKDPSNHHTKFEVCWIYCWFYKNPKTKWISHRFVLVAGTFYQPQCKHNMGNSLTSKIFIKSAVDPRNLKFGMMITWVFTIVQKNFSLP